MPTKTVLMVSGSAHVRAAAVRAIRGEGHRALAAANALEAMLICACGSIDLVMVDPELAGISGTQLASTIARALPDVPVMVLARAGAGEAEILDQVREGLIRVPSRPPASAAGACGSERKSA